MGKVYECDIHGSFEARDSCPTCPPRPSALAEVERERDAARAALADVERRESFLRAFITANPGMKDLEWVASGDAAGTELCANWTDGGVMWPYLAEEIGRTLGDAPNFVTLTLSSVRDGRAYEVTMRRVEGKTPAIVIGELQAARAAARAFLAALLDALPCCQRLVDEAPGPVCGKPATHSTAWTDHEVDRCTEHSKGAKRCSIADAIDAAERELGRRT